MKQREPRQKVMLSARLRHDGTWADANILNVSTRGLLLHGSIRPARGTYLEIRRGSYVIVGRVVWVSANRFGVRTQDRLAIDSLIANAPLCARPANDSGATPVERRARPRSEGLEWRYAANRDRGRFGQFAMIAAFGAMAALMAFEAAGRALSLSMAQIAAHLTASG